MRLLDFFVLCFASCIVMAASVSAQANSSWQPLAVYLDCQSRGRTKICPAFIHSFIEQSPLLRRSPRADSHLTLQINATSIANTDEILLTFTSTQPKLPPIYEVRARIDTRQTDDEVRRAVEPAFVRGIAFYLGQHIPGSVEITLATPNQTQPQVDAQSPWGFFIWLGGHGNWSETSKEGTSWGGIGFHRKTSSTRIGMNVSGSYGLSRRPPITDALGNEIPMNFESHGLHTKLLAAMNLDEHWSTGLYLRAGHQDPEGRYRWTARGHTGISYDLFAANDPRGNRFSVAYLIGYQGDRYNNTNDLNELRADFATHALLSEIAVRDGRQTYRLRASIGAQLLDPNARYVIDVSPEFQFQLGDHVDLSLRFGITQQQVPGAKYIAPQNYELLERSSYSDPLKMNGSFNLSIHFDRSNGERNDRWELVNRLGELGSL